jgi:hypothetical protein
MAFCDVCARPAGGDIVPNADFRRAVGAGFDPFSLGLPGDALRQVITAAQMSGRDPFEMWRQEVVERETTDWRVCLECMSALRSYLPGPSVPSGLAKLSAAAPTRMKCSKCGAQNPGSQWHCSTCGHIQWGLIVFSLLVGMGLAWWAVNLDPVWGKILAGLGAALFLWIGISSIRDGLRDRSRL